MTSNSSKAFGPIRVDYAFFEDHATEAEQDIRAYLPYVRPLAVKRGPIRMLEFGCGEGKFTSRFLEAAAFPRDRLELSLVEPDDVYRRCAVERLTPLCAHPLSAWPALPPGLEGCFDLVLSNHVFYYVMNLDEALESIRRALAPDGLFLAAMAGQENTLIQFWNHCFGLIGKPVPFHTAEDFEAALVRQRLEYVKQDVKYELTFPDSEENRLKILRFLLGSHFPDMPRRAVLDVFNLHSVGDRIVMRIIHEHFVIRQR
jgi:trans-aconitate 2-methyltransferase